MLFDPTTDREPTSQHEGLSMKAAVFHGAQDIRVEEVAGARRSRARTTSCCGPSGAASAAPTSTSTPWVRSSSRPSRTR